MPESTSLRVIKSARMASKKIIAAMMNVRIKTSTPSGIPVLSNN
jgi:hypothetical protein